MRFLDSSAIIPLCVKERASEAMEGLMKGDEDVVVWWTDAHRVPVGTLQETEGGSTFLRVTRCRQEPCFLRSQRHGQKSSQPKWCGCGQSGFYQFIP